MARDESDSQLTARYRGGEVAALELVVAKYRRPLFGFIFNMTNGRDDADDVFQEVWLRAIRKMDGYKDDNLCGWLMRIAHNVIIDRVRRRKPDFSMDDDRHGEGQSLGEVLPAAGLEPGRQVEAGDLGRRIEEAVAALPDEQKEVFLLRVEGDLPFKEIAAIQEVSINTALARMQYALAKLRELLKEDYRLLTT